MDFIGSLIASPFICLGWLIAGAVAGALANRIMGGKNKPLLIDIITGLVGAFVGNIIIGALNIQRDTTGFNGFIVSILVGIVGAVVIIAVLRAVTGRR